MNSRGLAMLCAIFSICLVSQAGARTIVLGADRIDRMAVIHEAAPRLGWAAHNPRAGHFDTGRLELAPESRLLVRFDLSDIPPGQRIINAELIVPVSSSTGVDPRLTIWRITVEWGEGVCHDFRVMRPDPKLWTVPGASGAGSDRALRPSASARVVVGGDQILNVAADTAIWYMGSAPNYGWIFSVDDPGACLTLPLPATGTTGRWLLRITYEPE